MTCASLTLKLLFHAWRSLNAELKLPRPSQNTGHCISMNPGEQQGDWELLLGLLFPTHSHTCAILEPGVG